MKLDDTLTKLERESDYDNIIAKWAETCKTVTGGYVQGEVGGAPSVTESLSESTDNPSLEEGWAMKKFALICRKHSSKEKKPVLKQICCM